MIGQEKAARNGPRPLRKSNSSGMRPSAWAR